MTRRRISSPAAALLAALKATKFQGIAYAEPVTWKPNGDNRAAVVFINSVEDEHFKEIAAIERL